MMLSEELVEKTLSYAEQNIMPGERNPASRFGMNMFLNIAKTNKEGAYEFLRKHEPRAAMFIDMCGLCRDKSGAFDVDKLYSVMMDAIKYSGTLDIKGFKIGSPQIEDLFKFIIGG